ncbi:MAG: zinc ABC transporter substrate-binding protein, partial [Candidatus Aminicenantes bacterium]|nr:zinc ABC transporter substrate-binding protein [Candidatus Aminicenantes bacterium]
MSKKWMVLTVIGLTLAGWLLSFGVQKPSVRPKIKIMTTVFPLLEFARAVAGERGEVSLLLPPGAEVHTWQPSFGDVRKLASLDAFIYIGSGLEPWAGDLLRGAGRPDLRLLEI